MDTASAALKELTLDQLGTSLTARFDGAATKDLTAWQLLVDLAHALAAATRDDELVNGRRWLLRSLTVTGFRGAKDRVELVLEHDRGLTVLHGENGSGKSSIAEALRMALEGRTGATHLGSVDNKGVHQIWGNSDERSQGVSSSLVVVSLCDEFSGDLFEIRATVGNDEVTRHGKLISGGDDKTFDSDSNAWNSWNEAVRTSPPVLAYAELAEELQKKSDLNTWLTSCLAMDNAVRLFETRVKERHEEAKSAFERIERARKEAIVRLRNADTAGTVSGLVDIVEVAWEELSTVEARDDWLARQRLRPQLRGDEALPLSTASDISTWVTDFSAAETAYVETSLSALTTQVANALVDLDEQVRGSLQDANRDRCPACGSQSDNWREHLHRQSLSLTVQREAASSLRRVVREAGSKFLKPSAACMRVLKSLDTSEADFKHGLSLLQQVDEQSGAAGELDVPYLRSLRELSSWVSSPVATGYIVRAVEASGLKHEWECNRWDAVADYVDTWNQDWSIASTAADWKAAVGKWNSELGSLRKARALDLRLLVAPAVEQLLGDVGFTLDGLDITKAASSLKLKNKNLEDVQLSHLSAGQRNALILGPVLATAEGGIFAFTLLDDPVHAFDDFRVDRLAATLSAMGTRQSVILTTHDGRFVEYLRVHAPKEFSVVVTERDAFGTISLRESAAPWAELIDFAQELAPKIAKSGAISGRADIATLLRMAVDEALEALSLRLFAQMVPSRAAMERLRFAEIGTTKDRASYLRDAVKDVPAHKAEFSRGWNAISPLIRSWSDSVHNPNLAPGGADLHSHIAAARQACTSWQKIHG